MANRFKKSLDIPEDLYEQIMEYALREKLYKFSPAVIKLLEKALKEKVSFDLTKELK